jgi:FAD/FMN-containing dehydrogenase
MQKTAGNSAVTVATEPRTAIPIDAIARVVGDKGVIADAASIAPYLEEQRGQYHGTACLVVRPASTDEVAAVVRICAAAQLPIVPQGGNTGLVGAAVPQSGDAIVLSLARMNRVRAIDAIDFTVTVEAGCVLADVQRAAAEVDRLFPLSLGAEGSCMIGGNLATNAGGIAVLRYGNMRDLTLGLEVVLPDGDVWNGLRALRKDNTGYDLKQLFIGSEGTLGVITAATLKLFPRPRETATAFLGLTRVEDAMALFARARAASGDQLTAFELIPRLGLDMGIRHVPGVRDPLSTAYPWYALLEVSSSKDETGASAALTAFLEEAMAANLVADGVIAASTAQARDLWRIREGMVEGQKYEGASLKHDISVPVSRVADFIKKVIAATEATLPGIRPLAFGHVGDGNVHFNLSRPVGGDDKIFMARRPEFNHIVHDITQSFGGSISAEHGIGLLKREELPHYKAPLELALMRKLKQTLDPQGIMNPGKIFVES